MRWLWRLRVLIWMAIIWPASAFNASSDADVARCLLAFKSTLTDPDNRLRNWQSRNPFGPCSWTGVDCLSREPELGLDLHSLGLSGTLQLQSFNSCTAFTSLELYDNNFSGPVPAADDICSSRVLPSLRVLDLSRNRLDGAVPAPGPGVCSGLEVLQLEMNLLAGPVPEELAALPVLRLLDLSHNRLQGTVPSELLHRAGLAMALDDNPGLVLAAQDCGILPGVACASGNTIASAPASGARSSRSSRRRLVWVVVLAACAALVVLVAVVVWRWRARGFFSRVRAGRFPVQSVFRRMGGGVAGGELRVRDLWTATGNFDKEHEIGAGGFSTVYRAVVQDAGVVAVKWLNKEQKLGPQRQERAFRRELNALLTVKHRNLVQILGYVAKADMRLLILEYMPNGSLEQQLHGVSGTAGSSAGSSGGAFYVCPLSWQQRCEIALGVAMGLDYLHKGIKNPLVHLDLKPSNILLDARMVARISDFGLAKLVSQANATTHTLFWTVGYTAPEVFLGAGGTATKADVYSFGVLLLELITRQRPTSSVFGDGVTLVGWVKQALETQSLHTVLDPALTVGGKHEVHLAEMTVLCKLGLVCAQHVAAGRPHMSTVVDVIANRARHAPLEMPSIESLVERSDKLASFT